MVAVGNGWVPLPVRADGETFERRRGPLSLAAMARLTFGSDMSSDPEPAPFFSLKLAEVRRETPELTHFSVSEASAELLAAYRVPGQYARIQVDGGKPGFFALACGPGRGRLEFLIKKGSPLTELLAGKQAGDRLNVGAPEGPGYPLASLRGHDLYLCGVGSGIAPLRAAVHEILRERTAYGAVRFYYGVRKACDFPYAAELDAWLAHDVEVTRVCSQPEHGTWNGLAGRVPEVLRRRRPALAPGTRVLACGMKPFVEDLKTVFGELGLQPGHLHQNF